MKKSVLKSLLTVAVLLTLSQFSVAQHRTCGTMQHMADLQKQDSKLNIRLQEAENMIQDYLAKHPQSAQRTTTVPDTIAVVVHVVYKTAAQNVSDAQIQSQIDVLNADFGRLNADTVNTPAPWKPISGGLPYYFILARRDPNGASTTGITRTSTTTTTFSTNNAVKYAAQGGADAWNTAEYFNIWVCNLGTNLLGYGEFPTGTATPTRGFVCNYTCFGNMGTAQAPFNGGRTATHEIGHCFNLYHIWGDDNGACSGTDYVSDTPNQANRNFGAPTFPLTDACTTTAPGVMFMNYMDYTDDAAMNMYTNGQVARMSAAITTFYAGLINSPGTQPVNLQVDDASLSMVVSPSGSACNLTVTPVVRLKNAGGNTLTSCDIQYSFDGGTVATYNWTGSLASLATIDVTLPATTLAGGSHTFNCNTANPNNGTDANASNDASSSTFSINGGTLPYTQGFEGSFPPAEHTIVNDDADVTWAQSTAGYHTGTASMYLDNANYSAGSGMADDFILPALDFSTAAAPQMSFYHAYKLWTNPTSSPNYSDTLQILISTDCGVTFSKVFENYGVAMTTGTPTFQASDFVPTSAQWRKDSLDLSAYVGNSNVVIAFRNVSDYENNLYIDDINIVSNTAQGISSPSAAEAFAAYPNPSNGRVHVVAKGVVSGVRSIAVRNVLGVVVMNIELPQGSDLNSNIDLSSLSAGVYMLELKAGNSRSIQRIAIEK